LTQLRHEQERFAATHKRDRARFGQCGDDAVSCVETLLLGIRSMRPMAQGRLSERRLRVKTARKKIQFLKSFWHLSLPRLRVIELVEALYCNKWGQYLD
jgi:hypothetical protein